MTKWARVCFLVVGTRTAGPETSTLNLENELRSFYFPSPTTKIHFKFTLKDCRAVLERFNVVHGRNFECREAEVAWEEVLLRFGGGAATLDSNLYAVKTI